jgi:hypothetical protein
MVDESGMSRTQMGSRVDQNVVAVALDALYDTTPYDTLTYFHSNSDVGG